MPKLTAIRPFRDLLKVWKIYRTNVSKA